MKKFMSVTICLLCAFVVSFATVACEKSDNITPPPLPEDPITEPEKPEPTPEIIMNVAATKTEVTVTVCGSDESFSGDYDLVELKPYEYFEGEENGMSESIVAEGRKIGTYTAGIDKTFSVGRYDTENDQNGFDRVYDKFYLVRDGAVALGPMYATEIASQTTAEPEYMSKITSKKGLADNALRFSSIYQDRATAQSVGISADNDVISDENGLITLKDLGCQHVGISYVTKGSFDKPGMFIANENDETIGEVTAPENTLSFTYNGVEYKFNKDYVDILDKQVKAYSDAGIDITAEIDLFPEDGLPYDLTYAKYGGFGLPNSRFAGINTSNAVGFGYWGAAMEFLAKRYSGGSNGYISTYVIGNEIDYSYDYFCIAKDHQDIDTYVEEYGRALRTANTAVKKYNSNIEVVVTFTHSWANPGHTSNDNMRNYAAKDILDKLNAKTKAQGDFDWGVGPHCYGFSLATTRLYEYDTKEGKNIKVNADNGSHVNYPDGTVEKLLSMTGDYNTSDSLTFSNLELIEQYLNRDEMKCNGKVRNVYLQEPGASSSGYYGDNNSDSCKTTDSVELSEAIQAAVIAAAWYKVSQLDCIKAYEYFVPLDDSTSNFMPGLMLKQQAGKSDRKKPSYYLWKYIDTQYSYLVSGVYLPYITYYDVNGNYMTYGNGINSYRDVLDIFGTGYDFSHFDNYKAAPRKIEGTLPSFGFTLPAVEIKPAKLLPDVQ